MEKKREVTNEEFVQMVEALIPKYPVTRKLREANLPYEKWGANIQHMVNEKLGITRRTIMEIGVDKPLPSQQ